MAFNYRYAPHHTKIRELVRDGVIGEVYSVHFEWLLNTVHGADYYRRWHRNKANSGGLLVHKELVTRDPERVRRMVAAHKRATEQLCAEPQGWLDAAARLTGLERELLEQAASNMELTWDMDTAFLRRLAALGARMKALGLIAREPDYAALVDTRFVNALRTPSAGDSAPAVR